MMSKALQMLEEAPELYGAAHYSRGRRRLGYVALTGRL